MPSKIFAPGLLDGQVAIVSGGGSGLGRASALELAACGATVVVCGRRREPLDETVARAAAEGSGLPVTVKLRAEGVPVARRLVEEAGVAGITFHPRNVKVRHKGTPDYDLAAGLVADLPVPVIVSGGMHGAEHIHRVFEHTGCAAVMIARGGLGNPWLFEQVLGTRDTEPDPGEVVREWLWVLDRAVEHLGEPRAARYLKKFHPWYVERLGAGKELQNALQRADTVEQQRTLVQGCAPVLSSATA